MSIPENSNSLSSIYSPIKESIQEVRCIIMELWHDVLRLVNISNDSVPPLQAEGKLLRPALCLLSVGALGKSDTVPYSKLAASYEAMHLASLAHDDVLDHASLRRGQSSLNAYWNEHAAILGGDYLVARSLELMVGYGRCDVISNVLRAVQRMAEGELHFIGKSPENTRPEDCIALADAKTASLFAASCAGPAILTAPERVPCLEEYGISLGIAFQLIDDLLDITQPYSIMGKKSCGDISEGKYTLPIILLRDSLSSDEKQVLDSMIGRDLSEEECSWVRQRALNAGIENKLSTYVNNYIDKSILAVMNLPSSTFRDSLIDLAQFIPKRLS